MPPVTLIYLGARRTGILATEADIPTLFVLSHNVYVSVCVRVRACLCVCVSSSIETCSWNANRHLTTACNGSGFIGICVKAVYIVPATVTNRHDNAVRQGLVSPFLCLTSLGNVYTLTLKWGPTVLHAKSDPIPQQTCPQWGHWWKDAGWPLIENIQHSQCGWYKSIQK